MIFFLVTVAILAQVTINDITRLVMANIMPCLYIELWQRNCGQCGYAHVTHNLVPISHNEWLDNMTTNFINKTIDVRSVIITYCNGKMYFNRDNTKVNDQYVAVRETNQTKWFRKHVPEKKCEWHWRKGNDAKIMFAWEIDVKPHVTVNKPTKHQCNSYAKKIVDFVFDDDDFPALLKSVR